MLTAKELAEKLSVCPQTIRRLTTTGEIPAAAKINRSYRYDYDEVMKKLKGVQNAAISNE